MRIRPIYVFGLAAALSSGCSKPTSTQVARRDVIGYEVLKGDLVTPPTAQVSVLPPYRAPVEKVMVTVGAQVKRGDVLMQLSLPSAEAAYSQARGRVKAAEAALSQAKTQYGAEVRAAEQALAQARTSEREARALVAEGATGVSLPEVTRARMAAEQNLQAAKADLSANLVPFQQQLEDAREYLRAAQSGAKQASIRAPIAGTVLELNAQSGQEVGADAKQPVAKIVDLGALMVYANLSAEQFGFIKQRAEVKLTFKGLDREFEGRVRRVTTTSVEGEMDPIAHIEFDNDQGLVKPGAEVAGVAVKTGEAKDVLAVPTASVEKDSSGKPFVNVLINGDWVANPVEVGLSGTGFTEIKSGLNDGQTVQVTP
ncbi:MAG: efflux RND transporter periplasmic adaptor subunit [Fimbriimonadales bacterium]